LKPNVIATIERWLGINDQEEFTQKIYCTLRDIYTFLSNMEAPVTTAMNEFKGQQVDQKPPRFD
jgi:hypothetical protein